MVDVIESYQKYLSENPEHHPAVSAIRVLTEVLRSSEGIVYF
jgi:hypothetical protein